MITQIEIAIRQATEADRDQLTSLIQLEPYVHRHLDWRTPLDWLGYQPYLVAEKAGNILAALACPPDPPGVSWIRTFAAVGHMTTARAWKLLWNQAQEEFGQQSEICVAAIPLYKWFRKLLEKNDFAHTHNVVLLAWENPNLPPRGKPPAAMIRAMTLEDLPAVTEVDHAAFSPLWRNSLDSLARAHKQSVLATIAEDEEGIVGYQISTHSPHGWHLARLAVHPRKQKKGIAYAITRNLLGHFHRTGYKRITVNTKHDNLASLYLYTKAGFYQTGEEYPVYQHTLNPC